MSDIERDSDARRGGDPVSEAESVFARYLLHVLRGESLPFRDFCARYPDLESDLMALFEAWSARKVDLRTEAPPARRPTTVRERIVETFGPTADPGITLEKTIETTPIAGTEARLSRIAARFPRASRYTVRREIGGGGMGDILEVWDEDLRRTLAMKVVRGTMEDPSSGGSPKANVQLVARFLEEAQITAQLEHPGVVPVHELGVDNEARVFFTMRHVKGKNLEEVLDLVKKGKEGWTHERAVATLLRACDAMAYAHSKGVIHRDLKPSNIMVGKFGEVYVMDWGLAKIMGRETAGDRSPRKRRESETVILETDRHADLQRSPGSPLGTVDGQVIGTPVYMPPEQARGNVEHLGPTVDVYSMGAILYTLLTGHRPYLPEGVKLTQHEVLRKVLEGPPEPVHDAAPTVPAELAAICEKAMARRVDRRYSDMQEMAEDLRAFLETRVVRAYRTGPVAELRKWIVRNRGTATALAALLVLVVAASLGFAWIEQSRKASLARAYGEVERERDAKGRLSDIMGARALVAEAEARTPDTEGTRRLEGWLRHADELLSRRDHYRSLLEGGGTVAEDERGDLVDLLRNIDAIEAAAPDVREYTLRASVLPRRTLEEPAAAWEAAIASIAESSKYGGLAVRPQLGLVPLGASPESGLWEFWHVLSGERPRRDPATDRWMIDEKTGIVLVLLPGGSFAMGSPPDEPNRAWDERQHSVTVEPFFLSKYETTQAQWERAMGTNPSEFPPGTVRLEVEFTGAHPVECVTFSDCSRLAARLGLVLPTEEQWEYAARAGSSTAFEFGREPSSVEMKENLGDRSLDKLTVSRGQSLRPGSAPWDDRFPLHAPVGVFAPNRFGLHDISGNVAEWTSSRYDPNYGLVEGDPGYITVEPAKFLNRIARGGNFYWGPDYTRIAIRQPIRPGTQNFTLGVRLARPVDR